MSPAQPLPVAASGNPGQSARSAGDGNASAPSHVAAREAAGSGGVMEPGWQLPTCTTTPRAQRAAVTPCTAHILLYPLALEANKAIATHDPAARGQKGHSGAGRWEDPKILTSSKTPGVGIQALSCALSQQQAGPAQPPRSQGRIPPIPKSDKLGRGLSKERCA